MVVTVEEFRRSGEIGEALTAAMETSGRAVLFVALAISTATADFYSFHVVGFFVPLTMIVSCLTALTLLPALVLLLRPGFIFEPRGQAPAGEKAGPERLRQAAGSR